MGKPSLDEFRKWLQSEIREIESLEVGPNVEKRLLQLEMALQEQWLSMRPGIYALKLLLHQ